MWNRLRKWHTSLGLIYWFWTIASLASWLHVVWRTVQAPTLLNGHSALLFGLLAAGFACRSWLCFRSAVVVMFVKTVLRLYWLTQAFNWTILGLVIVDVALGVYVWRWAGEIRDLMRDSESQDQKRPIVSIVALLQELPYIDAEVVRRAANRVWGDAFLPLDEVPKDARHNDVVGSPPSLAVVHESGPLIVNVLPRPYWDDPAELARSIRNARIAEAVRTHQAWVSVDALAIDPRDSAGVANAYADIGRLLAQLIDDDCLGLCFPQFHEIHPYDPEMAAGLRCGNPRQAARHLQQAPVVELDGDDPRMQAAAQTARSRWPEFVTAFEHRTEHNHFAVKASIARGGNREFNRIEVTAVEGETIFGKLANEPLRLPGLALGDNVTVPSGELNDWRYTTPKQGLLLRRAPPPPPAHVTLTTSPDSPAASPDAPSGSPSGAPDVFLPPGVLPNDSSPHLSAELVLDPEYGAFAFHAAGSFTSTPAAGCSGADRFVDAVTDGSDTAYSTVTIAMLPAADSDEGRNGNGWLGSRCCEAPAAYSQALPGGSMLIT